VYSAPPSCQRLLRVGAIPRAEGPEGASSEAARVVEAQAKPAEASAAAPPALAPPPAAAAAEARIQPEEGPFPIAASDREAVHRSERARRALRAYVVVLCCVQRRRCCCCCGGGSLVKRVQSFFFFFFSFSLVSLSLSAFFDFLLFGHMARDVLRVPAFCVRVSTPGGEEVRRRD